MNVEGQTLAVTGENICIDCNMTRNMIYRNDFGWSLER